jgi:hypothetical protein
MDPRIEVVRQSWIWRVSYNDVLTAPTFHSEAGANAYARSVKDGKVPPDFGPVPLVAPRPEPRPRVRELGSATGPDSGRGVGSTDAPRITVFEHRGSWRVMYNDGLVLRRFLSEMDAKVYAERLRSGEVRPDFGVDPRRRGRAIGSGASDPDTQ